MNYTKHKKVALYAAKKAGDELLKKFRTGNYTLKFKSKHEIVTNVDIDSNTMILDIIKKNFPEHAILSEETGKSKNKSEFLWVVDPLDGTTNFFSHNPLFCVAIALVHNNEPVLSVIYAPYTKEMYWAKKGKGAFESNKPLKVSKQKNIDRAFINYCHGYTKKSKEKAIDVHRYLKLNKLDSRHFGSTSLECAYVAAGHIDTIFIPQPHAWDVVAGILLIREAGGKVTSFDGEEWSLKSKSMLASNKHIHKDMLKIVNR